MSGLASATCLVVMSIHLSADQQCYCHPSAVATMFAFGKMFPTPSKWSYSSFCGMGGLHEPGLLWTLLSVTSKANSPEYGTQHEER